MPIGLYFQFAERAGTLDSVSAYRTEERNLTGDGEPLRANVLLTTPSLSAVLRVPPAMGRWFTEEEGGRAHRPWQCCRTASGRGATAPIPGSSAGR